MEHEDDGDIYCNWWAQNNSQRLDKETGRVGNQRTSLDLPNFCIIDIGQNTEKSPGNLGFVLKNEIHKILWEFEIQMNHQISTRRLNQE